MASELFAARSDFASFGSSLASIQQNAIDDQISNNAALQNYGNVSAQLKASIPSGFGDIAFGAYELLGQGKDLIGRISKVRDAVAAAPNAIKDALVKGGNKLGARGDELKSLVSDTKASLEDATGTLKTNLGASFEELKTTATGGVESIMSTGKTALESAATTGKTALENAVTSGQTALQSATEKVPLIENQIEARLPEYGQGVEMTDFASAGRSLASDVPSATKGFSFTTGGLEPNYNMYSLSPARVLPTESIQNLQSEGGAALTKALGVPEQIGGQVAGAGKEVATTLANTATKGGELVNQAVTSGVQTTEKVASTLQEAGGAAANIVKGAATDVAETALEAGSVFLPVLGEVTAVALGAVQVYEGFKDLFSHPSAAAPVTVAMPTVTNIGQTFQSGI